MKVLYLVTDGWYFLSHRLALARAARDAGGEVVVVTAPGPEVEAIRAEGFRHVPLTFQRRLASQLGNGRVLRELVGVYREVEPDLVHHVAFFPIFFGTLAARRAGTPAVVNTVPGLGHAFASESLAGAPLRFLIERAYRLALGHPRSVTLFQNEEDRDHFVSKRLVERERTDCIPGSGVDTERFVPHAPAEDPVVLHASRMLWSKGVADTVEACRILGRRGVAHRLLLAGRTHPANPESIPEERLERWSEEGVATWVGHREDMPGLYAESSVVCLPSCYREGVPMALLEAASAGRPIVTTDVPGCRDVVGHGTNGFIVPVRSPERLADALQRLLTEPELGRRMGRSGRDRVLARFSKEIVTRRTLDAYRALLADRWPAPGVYSNTRP
jgi:glycosyltransferase involved in cell wall biosynthesis